MTKHPTPWKLIEAMPGELSGDVVIIDAERNHILMLSEDDVRVGVRIVECVNACDGLEPKALQELANFLAPEKMEAYLIQYGSEKFELDLADKISRLKAKGGE